MAINRISFPSSTPASLTDWSNAVAIIQAYANNFEGNIRISGSNVVKGAAFSIGGVYYLADADTAISGTASDYVRITPAGATASAAFVASLTGVTWNSAYNGYYDGSGNLYVFDEIKAYYENDITTLHTIRNWNPEATWADSLGAAPNTAVTNNNSATVAGIDPVNGNAGTYGTLSIPGNGRTVIPKGTYIFAGSQSKAIQVYTGSSWVGSGALAGLVISDGVNFAVSNSQSSLETVYYRKLA